VLISNSVELVLYLFPDCITEKTPKTFEMTCDNVNGKLDKLTNNNNVTCEVNRKLNGFAKQNGKSTKERSTPLLDEEELETRKSLMILASIFITALLALFYIYKNFPRLDE
jgi:hypothetical protein